MTQAHLRGAGLERMPRSNRKAGRLSLLVLLFAGLFGCGPAVVFPSRAPDQFYVFGHAELEAEFGTPAPIRRRYRFRAFNHFLHPFEQLTWTLSTETTPAEASFDITLQDGLHPINGSVPPYILRHRFGEAFEIDVTSSGGQLHLEVEAVFTQSADVESPPQWSTRPLELLVEEIPPTNRPFGTWRFAQDGGPRPAFPPREVRCGEHPRPHLILESEGPPLNLPGAEVKGAWLDLWGVELDDVEVQFGDVPSPRLIALRRDYVQAEIPLLPAGAVDVRVRSGEARTVIADLFGVRDTELTALAAPPAGAAVGAVDDGSRRFVATADGVYEVMGQGYQPSPPAAIQPSGIRALYRRPEGLWAATHAGLFVSEANGPFEIRLEGRFSALGEISAGILAVGGDPHSGDLLGCRGRVHQVASGSRASRRLLRRHRPPERTGHLYRRLTLDLAGRRTESMATAPPDRGPRHRGGSCGLRGAPRGLSFGDVAIRGVERSMAPERSSTRAPGDGRSPTVWGRPRWGVGMGASHVAQASFTSGPSRGASSLGESERNPARGLHRRRPLRARPPAGAQLVLALASLFALGVFGCGGDADVIEDGFAEVVTLGRADWTVAVGGSQPVRPPLSRPRV